MVATLKNRTSSVPRDINSIINWLWQLGDALVFGWDQVLFLLMKIRLGIVERYFDQLGHPFDVFVAPLILLLLCNCSLAASSTSWFIKIISLMRRRQSFGHVPLCMPLSVAPKAAMPLQTLTSYKTPVILKHPENPTEKTPRECP